MKKVKNLFVFALLAMSVSLTVVACNNGEEAKPATDTAAAPAAAPSTTDTAAPAAAPATAGPDTAATKPVKTPTN